MVNAPGQDLLGRVALVTGASGALGAHFARVLARAGATLAIAARRIGVLTELAGELRECGARALPLELDVTSATSVRDCVATVAAELGSVDILVNNAGVAVTKPLLEQTEADWDIVLDTNLKGAYLMASEVARRLRDAGHPGRIINIASILGLRQAGGVTPYAVSKAGLIQLTKQMALELARYNIQVNAIAPGYVETDLNREFLTSEAGHRVVGRIPQQRVGRREDLDGPLLLLASDASGLMTGSVLVVDGGHLLTSL
jgi:NAD(P)-dependent dehydrogenase (short-subunit alcohol dehydrogenase family)